MNMKMILVLLALVSVQADEETASSLRTPHFLSDVPPHLHPSLSNDDFFKLPYAHVISEIVASTIEKIRRKHPNTPLERFYSLP